MFIYNVHTQNKTFALAIKEGESHSSLVARIVKKAGYSEEEQKAVKSGKDGAGLVYEFEGARWSLEDDDDLDILHSRYPPTSTSSATLHLVPPHAHAHFAKPPAYTAASALKNKSAGAGAGTGNGNGVSTAAGVQKSKVEKAVKSDTGKGDKGDKSEKGEKVTSSPNKPNGTHAHAHVHSHDHTQPPTLPPPISAPSISAPAHHFPHSSHSGNKPEMSALSKPTHGEKLQVVGHRDAGKRSVSATGSGGAGGAGAGASAHLAPPISQSRAKSLSAPSVRSTTSRKSRWGDDNAEPLWETQKRAWLEFHNGTGVRTVTGNVGNVKDVRMLLKPGYKGVYISRHFAIKHKLVPRQFGMGAGYTGLCTLGKIDITVAGRTASHQAMISEEAHFDVVLGRQWVERMNVKIDPIDQTILTYMDSGEGIPCDIVVLKDAQGNKIHLS